MSTHNICFCGEKRKNIMWIPPLICSYAEILEGILYYPSTIVCWGIKNKSIFQLEKKKMLYLEL